MTNIPGGLIRALLESVPVVDDAPAAASLILEVQRRGGPGEIVATEF